LAQDPDLEEIWNSEDKIINLFFKILRIFTIIDILGYSYSKIFDHYFLYYSNISKKLNNLFIKFKEFEKDVLIYLYNNLKRYDEKYIKWRLCGSIRIFQFVNTKAFLSEDFFYSKIAESLKIIESSYEEFQSQITNLHHLVQFKYALPIMMILATHKFLREPPSTNFTIKSEIFKFWKLCCEKSMEFIKLSEEDGKVPFLSHFVFHFPANWYFKEEFMNYIPSKKFLNDLKEVKPLINRNLKRLIFSFHPSIS